MSLRIQANRNVLSGRLTRFWRIIFALSLLGNVAVVYIALKAIEYRNHINFFLEKYTVVIDEFSQRDKYLEANRALPAPSAGTPRVVFLGTQVTERWPIDSQLVGYEFINRGVYGQRAAGLLLRFWSDVIALTPSVVVIEISSYNLRPETGRDELEELVRAMSRLARESGIVPIVTTMVPPLDGVTGLGEYDLRDTIALYNQWIRAYVDSTKIPLLDIDRHLANKQGFLKPELAMDDIDPNTVGYHLLSEQLQDLLDSLLHLPVPPESGIPPETDH